MLEGLVGLGLLAAATIVHQMDAESKMELARGALNRARREFGDPRTRSAPTRYQCQKTFRHLFEAKQHFGEADTQMRWVGPEGAFLVPEMAMLRMQFHDFQSRFDNECL